MKSITFHCETITPMFLAGADGKTPELRPPSIKGALRFWWRALNANLVEQKEDGTWDYSELKKREAEIFGGTENRSNVIVTVTEEKKYKLLDYISEQTFKESWYYNDLKYIAYGVYDRKFIKEGFKFKIILHYNPKFEDDILDTFFCFAYFGGLGSKARNGFGQFILKNDFTRNSVFDKINNELDDREYTAFTEYYFNNNITDSDAKNVWKKLAHIYKEAIYSLEKTNRNYIAKRNSDFQITGTGEYERIAKTYFFSINKKDNVFLGMVSYLPFIYPVNIEDYNNTIDEFSEIIEDKLMK